MEHKDIHQVRSIADIQPVPLPQLTSRRERLARWAELLDSDPNRCLNTLGEIEYAPKAERASKRADNSPLTIAFEDPVLRAAGLKSDRLGDALAFFEMTQDDAHCIMCSCLHGQTMKAGTAAARIRSGRRVQWFAPVAILAGMFGVPALLHLLR